MLRQLADNELTDGVIVTRKELRPPGSRPGPSWLTRRRGDEFAQRGDILSGLCHQVPIRSGEMVSVPARSGDRRCSEVSCLMRGSNAPHRPRSLPRIIVEIGWTDVGEISATNPRAKYHPFGTGRRE